MEANVDAFTNHYEGTDSPALKRSSKSTPNAALKGCSSNMIPYPRFGKSSFRPVRDDGSCSSSLYPEMVEERPFRAALRAHDIDLTIVFGLAAFGLSANGFDLSFLHPDTICLNPEYIQIARRMFDGKPVSAVGWDFGSQAQALQKYKMLCWIEAKYWDLQESDVFRIKQPVTDVRLVEKEAAAYSHRVHLSALR